MPTNHRKEPVTPRYVLTGTPGAGKTAVLRLLEARGHLVVEEAATYREFGFQLIEVPPAPLPARAAVVERTAGLLTA